MTGKQKRMLRRILLSGLLLIVVTLLPEIWLPGPIPFVSVRHLELDSGIGFTLARWPLYLIPHLILGRGVLWKAVRNIKNGQVFDENFLMAIATLGAFGCGEYAEAVAVMLFYQVGELFESVAVGRSRKSISDLMDIRPDSANVERDGKLVEVDPEDVQVGEIIVVKPGERIPLDGVVEEGVSALDTAALTGESLPRDVLKGDAVISGCVNLSGLLHIRVTKLFEQSTVAKILDLVENSSSKKAKAEHFITKFARYYTPGVVFAALVLAILPPLFVGQWSMWFQRALIFLVVSCPCALVISIPLSFFGGIGGASKQGILVKGSNYLEALAQAGIVVFDKTGTLTQGNFTVTEVEPKGISKEELLELAALAEHWSDHPISQSIRKAYGQTVDGERVSNAKEIAGQGIQALVDGKTILAGNQKLMNRAKIPVLQPEGLLGTVVHVAVDGAYAGYLVISDQIKPGAAQAIRELKQAGVRQTVMLTGDAKAVGQAVAAQLGLDQVHAELLPDQKVEQVERLLSAKTPKERLVFVGDGMNDAPVLSRSDVGVAMGALGSDAAIEAADIVLMDDKIEKLPQAIRLARKTLRIVRQNIVFALGIKFLVLLLTAFGYSNMWMAVFADVGVSVLAILNASRMLKAK